MKKTKSSRPVILLSAILIVVIAVSLIAIPGLSHAAKDIGKFLMYFFAVIGICLTGVGLTWLIKIYQNKSNQSVGVVLTMFVLGIILTSITIYNILPTTGEETQRYLLLE